MAKESINQEEAGSIHQQEAFKWSHATRAHVIENGVVIPRCDKVDRELATTSLGSTYATRPVFSATNASTVTITPS